MWEVAVDIAPRTIKGTNGCHKYRFGVYKTKREAEETAGQLRGFVADGIMEEAIIEVKKMPKLRAW